MASKYLKAYFQKDGIEAGCDEAGRGCLAGPVYAAAVVLPKNFKHKLLNDSKKLTHNQRIELRQVIEEIAISYAVAKLTHREIDKYNILQASFKAMHKAIKALDQQPTRLIIDGNRFVAHPNIPHHCIIKGDGKYASIAAASILAKTYRDEYMERLHKKHPQYAWDSNKGYPTLAHRQALKDHGASDYHRMSFRLYADQAELPFPKMDRK